MVRLVIAMNWETELRRATMTLAAHTGFSVIGTASDCYRALQLVESEQPDIAVVDYYLDNIKGWDLIPIIKRKSPLTSVIIISPYDDETHAWDALYKGASGYLVRKFDMDLLAGAIYMAHTGGRYVSHRIVSQVLPKFRVYQEYYRENFVKKSQSPRRQEKIIRLSDTERLIIEFLSQGRTTKEIAETLNLKIGTVRNYVSTMMRKIGGHSRAQMIFTALQWGLAEFVD
ncbi:MAG: response regulator transcription factor [Treponema sp.]|jgi:DNA-binding NarL/FixJ family response regulator|nr:response regulator transcription factor [Treponema sp.]